MIALHLISSSLYATKTLSKQHDVDFNTHECSFHHDTNNHEHFHSHNGSTHQHKHSHAKTSVNVLDFFVQLDDNKLLITSYSKEKYLEAKNFITNPTSKSIFRPPIV